MGRGWRKGRQPEAEDPKTIGAPFGAPRFCGQGSLSSPPGPASADALCRSLTSPFSGTREDDPPTSLRREPSEKVAVPDFGKRQIRYRLLGGRKQGFKLPRRQQGPLSGHPIFLWARPLVIAARSSFDSLGMPKSLKSHNGHTERLHQRDKSLSSAPAANQRLPNEATAALRIARKSGAASRSGPYRRPSMRMRPRRAVDRV